MVSQANDEAASFAMRLWRGQVALPWTFWLCGFGVAFVLKTLADWLLSFLLWRTSAQLSFDITLLVVNATLAVEFAYLIFISIAIWRSAARYAIERPRRKLFAVLAKIVVILNVAVFALNGARFISQQAAIVGAFWG